MAMDRPRRSLRAPPPATPMSVTAGNTPSVTSIAVENSAQSPNGMMAHPYSTPVPAPKSHPYASSSSPYPPAVPNNDYPRTIYGASLAVPNHAPAYGAIPQPPEIPAADQSAEPMKVFEPIGRGQARYTTFASRMRNGVASLMQPLNFSDTNLAGMDPINPRAARDRDRLRFDRDGGTPDRSRRAVRKYYGEELDEGDLEESEDDDAAKRKTNASGLATPAEDDEPDAKQYNQGVNLPRSKIQVRPAMTTGHRYFTDAEMARAAAVREVLVPIRIDIETDTHRIKDVFTWNITDSLVKPADFARVLVQDLDLPAEYAEQIETAIVQQLEDLGPFVDTEMMIGPARGGMWKARDASSPREAGKESRQWDYGIREEFEQSFKRASEGKAYEIDHEDQPHKRARIEESLDPAGVAPSAAKLSSAKDDEGGDIEDDIRVITDYEVQILRHNLRDRLEWDLCSPLTPEAFATRLCMDLGLSSEARSIIAHALREQIINHKRAAVDCDLVGAGDVYAKAMQTMMGLDVEDKKDTNPHLLPNETTDASPAALESVGNATLAVPELPSAIESSSGASTPAALKSAAPPTAATSALATPALTRAASFVDTLGSGAATPSVLQEAEDGPVEAAEQEESESSYVRREFALSTLKDLLGRGPRPLEGAWRDFFESLEFGPLLERLSEEDLDRLEEASNRISRRNRRDQQRAGAAVSQRFRRR